MDLLLRISGAFAALFRALGFSGTLWLVAGLLLLGLALKFLERADRVIDRLERRWRRLPLWGKQALALLALFTLGPTLWRWFPKTTGSLAVILGLSVAWWVGGLRLDRRYGVRSETATQAWRNHFAMSRATRNLTKAHEDGSTKKGGRARTPRKTATGLTYPFEPHDGQSAQEFADEVNDGKHQAAIARRMGWDAARSQTATVMPDGTVEVVLGSAGAEQSDPLADATWWRP